MEKNDYGYDKCIKCGNENDVNIKCVTDYIICECETKCWKCGHKDFWAYGFYESENKGKRIMNRTHIESACEEIDAAIFSGDILHDDVDRTELLEYVERWLREIKKHNEEKKI